jgi:S-formylglutathione hydrolase
MIFVLRHSSFSSTLALAVLAILGSSRPLLSQAGETKTGSVEVIAVRGPSLEGNLIGDAATREVSVYLPPGYERSPNRRYPVVYFLHGFTDSDAKWFGRDGTHWIHLPQVLDRAFNRDDASHMILVMPNALNAFQGSMYSTSVTIGDWERFVAIDLVSHIDKHYRTIPSTASRGLAGHSMGGYGTLRIGMKFPQVFSSIYAMSPCCLAPPTAQASPDGKPSPAESIVAVEEIPKADFGTKAQLASAAAWSPNPQKPPLFLDLPVKEGALQPEVQARWSANAPIAMVHQYIFNLKALTAIAFDAGAGDKNIHATSLRLDAILSDYKIPHDWASYEGDHLNRIAERIETLVIPYFSKHLRDR